MAGGAAGLASILAYMVDQNCDAGVLEVSREALSARCFDGVDFRAVAVTDVGIPFGLPTELAREARRAKARLVRRVVPGGAVVVNADDPHAELLGGLNLDARRVTFGLEAPARVDVSARVERMDASGTRLALLGFGPPADVALRLIGPRQVSHALAAAAVAFALGIDREAVVAGLEAVANIAGHLEAIDEGQDFDVRVDGATLAGPLAQALAATRAVAAGRIHCVLGAEGGQGQDRTTRSELAAAAEHGADRVILTLASPRTDDPHHLLHEVLAGFRRPGKVRVEPDRRSAIEAALSDARPGDAVLIAGKGRNHYQIFADGVVPFDDFAVARDWLRRHPAQAQDRRAG